MTERIALTINSESRLCPFPESAYIKILQKTSGNWQTEKLLPINLQVTNTEELRTRIRACCLTRVQDSAVCQYQRPPVSHIR